MGVAGQAGEKLGDLGFSHLSRVSLIVKKNEAPDPPDIGFLGFVAIVASADGLAHPVKELGPLSFGGICSSDDFYELWLRGVGRASGISGNDFRNHLSLPPANCGAEPASGIAKHVIGTGVKRNFWRLL